MALPGATLENPSMRRNDTFVQFAAEHMAFVDGLRTRTMFGGHGIDQGTRMFAIVTGGRLYLKADAVSRGAFGARILAPFTDMARDESVALQSFEAPPEVFEDHEAMCSWVKLARASAYRTGQARPTATRGKPRIAGPGP